MSDGLICCFHLCCWTFVSSSCCSIRRSCCSCFGLCWHLISLSLWFAHSFSGASWSSPFSLMDHMTNNFIWIASVIGLVGCLDQEVPSSLVGSFGFGWCCIGCMSGLLHSHLFVLIHLCFMFDVPNLVEYFHLKKSMYSFSDFDVPQLFAFEACYCIVDFVTMVYFQPDLGLMQKHWEHWFPYCSS